ncbi:MAG: hypothetical protein CL607_12680 [Anaerolineaceae bacterium]|nr:hypothetical protein [Anaerolineaceae bacterium]
MTDDKEKQPYESPPTDAPVEASEGDGSLALQNERLNAEIKRRTDQISAINIVASTVSHSLDLNLTLNTALDAVRNAVGAEAAGISLIDANANELVLRAQAGWLNDFVVTNPMRIPMGEGMSGKVIGNDEVLVHNDLDGSETYAVPSFKKERFRAIAMAPMHARGRIIGILSIMSHKKNSFDDDNIAVLKSIADTVGVAIENARLYESNLVEQNRLTAILHSSADGILATDQDGRISLINYAASQLLDVDEKAVMGVPLREAAIQERVRDAILKGIAPDAPPHQRNSRVHLEDGPELSIQVSPVSVPSQIVAKETPDEDGWVIVLQDITHLREAELARVQFIQAAAHDMKNPLGVTQSSIHMLEGMIDTEDETVKEVIGIARTGMKRLRRLIDDLMHIEEIESGYNFHLSEVDLREMCYEVGLQMQAVMTSQDIEFNTQVSSDVPAMMNLDREWMQRALTNYLENAIKYADDGAIMFNVYSSGDCVCFEVIDQGPGIPRQALPRLFDRFYRVDMRAKADGSGLGLAIVKSVAEAHGGQAYVESEEGKGSTFGISLPYQTEDTPGVASQDTSSTSEDAS